MDDLGAIEGQLHVQVSVHLFLIGGDEQVLVVQVPEHTGGARLEVGDHEAGLIHRIEQVAIACGVDAHAPGAGPVGEHFLQRILASVLQDVCHVLDQVVLHLTLGIDHDQELVS